jgi:hypothetical protein
MTTQTTTCAVKLAVVFSITSGAERLLQSVGEVAPQNILLSVIVREGGRSSIPGA